ncbi:9720_t:CDS:1, partial [Gigaspora margarita]
MNQSTNQTISAQLQNNGQQQRSHNLGGPQNAGGLLQRTLNTRTRSLRPQNTVNIFADDFIDVRRYTDLVEGIDLSIRTQDIENQSSQ